MTPDEVFISIDVTAVWYISALTTQIKLQEQLRYEAEREKMHANLLRSIVHDIRTPLAAILAAASSLQEE